MSKRKKFINRETLTYMFFGVCTTAIDLSIFYPLVRFTVIPAIIASVISWTSSVTFSYYVNTRYVFRSKVYGFKNIMIEYLLFCAGRVLSLLFESSGVAIADYMNANAIQMTITKVILSCLTTVLNYTYGKKIIFKKNKETVKDENN